jgi:hypothetical protein
VIKIVRWHTCNSQTNSYILDTCSNIQFCLLVKKYGQNNMCE